MNTQKLMQELGEIDEFFAKSQITQGGNSEQRSWAGSTWSDESIPTNTPNGTDYSSPKSVAHKAIGDMTESEIEQYLSFKKSGVSNPIQAEREIMSLEGVTKSVCEDCDGTRLDKSMQGACGECGGFGFFFNAPDNATAEVVKSIAEKFNVGRADDFFQKAQEVNQGGGKDEADTTPKDGGSAEKKSKLDNSGKKVAKGYQGVISKMDLISNEIAKMKKDLDGLEDLKEDEEEEHDKDYDNDDDGDDGDDEMPEGMRKMKKTKKAKKSLGSEVLLRSLQVVMGGMKEIMAHNSELGKAVGEQQHLLSALTQSHVNVSKSMANGVPQNGTQTRQPARGPQAVGPGVSVLEKAFATDAPGGEETTVTTRSGEEIQLRYAVKAMQAGAFEMVKAAPQEKNYMQQAIMRMDVGVVPDARVIHEIEGWLDKNGVPDA